LGRIDLRICGAYVGGMKRDDPALAQFETHAKSAGHIRRARQNPAR
jgi:hypothetical protein